jgi:hypothetical protein
MAQNPFSKCRNNHFVMAQKAFFSSYVMVNLPCSALSFPRVLCPALREHHRFLYPLFGGTLGGGTLVGGTLVGDTLVGDTLVGGTSVCGTLVGGTLVGGTLVADTLVGGTLVGGAFVGRAIRLIYK